VITNLEWKPDVNIRVLYNDKVHWVVKTQPDAFGWDVLIEDGEGRVLWVGSRSLLPDESDPDAIASYRRWQPE